MHDDALRIAWKAHPDDAQGATVEDVIRAAISRLLVLDAEVPSIETPAAIRHLCKALESLDGRRQRRLEQGLLGTKTPHLVSD